MRCTRSRPRPCATRPTATPSSPAAVTLRPDVRVISGDEEARLSYAGARAQLGESSATRRCSIWAAARSRRSWAMGRRSCARPRRRLASCAPWSSVRSPTRRRRASCVRWSNGRADAARGSSRRWATSTLGRVILCAGTARAVRSVGARARLHPDDGHGSRSGRTRHASLPDRSAGGAAAGGAPGHARPGSEPRRSDRPRRAMLDAILAGAGVEQARVCRAALREGLILERSRAPRTPARPRARRRARAAPSGTRPPSRIATIRATRPACAP